MKELTGKVAIVTGSARGIGRAIAEYFVFQGAFVYIADVMEDEAIETAKAVNKNKEFSKAWKLDVTSIDSVSEMVRGIIQEKGKIDILVNNAGVFSNTPIQEMKIEDWDRVLDINLRGTHLCSQAVIKEMVLKRSGKITNLSSMSSQTGGLKAGADYTASKGGVSALTKAYARYGAEFNINVNAVAPGFILTTMTEHWASKDGAGKDIPMGRVGLPIDVAKVVYFLSSSLSDYVTGQTISVNGGIIMN